MKYRFVAAIIAIGLVSCSSLPGSETPTKPAPTIEETATAAPTETLTSIPTKEPTETPLPTLTSTPEIAVISFKVSKIDGMVQVFVPQGEFEMGSDDGWESEKPVHTVRLAAYWIDQTEVTNTQYSLCVQAGACDSPGNFGSFTRDDYYNESDFGRYPVISVSWYDAMAYCEWAGRRLPTEAEWEKAARGDEGSIYPWGDDIRCELANYIDCIGDTSHVGSYPAAASPYGALDMAGNVWEWVADWYYVKYYNDSPLDYPLGPDSGAYRVVRGGSWNDYEWYLRTTNRYSYFPDNKRVSIGFRCVQE
jgi:formylglycine-generating enzyme required for sulfatase activity